MSTSSPVLLPIEQTSNNQWVHSLWFRILLFTALGLGVFFRVAGLGNKMYSHDEAYTSLYAAGYDKNDVVIGVRDGKDHTIEEIQQFLKPGRDKSISETLSSIFSGPQQAPLFFLLAHYWIRLIGYTPAAMRGLAVLFGILSIPAMYWLSGELFQSRRAALLSTALFALSPFHILFAQDARYYSLWTLATLLSSAALLYAMRRNDTGAWLLYSLTLILGVYSHQLFILVALVHGSYFAALFLLHHRREYRGFLSACLLAFLACTPWLYVMIKYWDSAAGNMEWVNQQIPWHRYIQNWALIFSSPFIDLDLTSGNLIPYLLRALFLVLIGYSFVFLIMQGSKQEKLFLLLMAIIPAGAFIVPDMLLGGIRSVSGRYFVPVNIVTILVVAYFIVKRLDQSSPNTDVKWRAAIGLLMVTSIFSNLNSLQADTWWNKELGRVRPDFIREIDKEQALLIVSTGYHGNTIGDVLLLSLEVDADVHFRLLLTPESIEDIGNYDLVFWFPGSSKEVQRISEKDGLKVKHILADTLWQIEETGE